MENKFLLPKHQLLLLQELAAFLSHEEEDDINKGGRLGLGPKADTDAYVRGHVTTEAPVRLHAAPRAEECGSPQKLGKARGKKKKKGFSPKLPENHTLSDFQTCKRIHLCCFRS